MPFVCPNWGGSINDRTGPGDQKRYSSPAETVGPYDVAEDPHGNALLYSQGDLSTIIARPKPPLMYRVPGPPLPIRRWRRPSVANAQVSRLTPASSSTASPRATGTCNLASAFENPVVSLFVYLLGASACVYVRYRLSPSMLPRRTEGAT